MKPLLLCVFFTATTLNSPALAQQSLESSSLDQPSVASDDPIDELLKKQLAAYRAPLLVDAKEFRDHARSELKTLFDVLEGEGTLVYEDAFVVNGDGRWNDFTRLYYAVKVKSSLVDDPRIFATYFIGTDGSTELGLVRYDAAQKNISQLFPGYLINYKGSVTLDEVKLVKANMEDQYPQLRVVALAPSLSPRLLSVHPKEPTREGIADLQRFVDAYRSDDRIEYWENDAEVRNPGLRADTIDLGQGLQSAAIDLNKLRTVTIQELEAGAPATSLPELACPFSKVKVCAGE